jgi:hypothetical protein
VLFHVRATHARAASMTDSTLVASLVLGYVDDARDRLALEAVSVAWRAAGRAPRSWAPRVGPSHSFQINRTVLQSSSVPTGGRLAGKPWCLVIMHTKASFSVCNLCSNAPVHTSRPAHILRGGGSTRRLGLAVCTK